MWAVIKTTRPLLKAAPTQGVSSRVSSSVGEGNGPEGVCVCARV